LPSNGSYSIEGHSGLVSSVVLYENLLFSGSFDATAFQWDKATGNLVKRFLLRSDDEQQVNSVAVSVDGMSLFTGSRNSIGARIVQWRVLDGARVRQFEGGFH
jgi:WD40 repeat protein